MLTNKYDFCKLNSNEPNNGIYDILTKHLPFSKAKKYPSLNNYSHDFIYFIDDLNVNYQSSVDKLSKSSTLELIRQIMETKSVYSDEDQALINLNNTSFLFACTYPGFIRSLMFMFDFFSYPLSSHNIKFIGKSANSLVLSQRLTKSTINVNLSTHCSSLIESIFLSPMQQWLEEFPSETMLYPSELAHVKNL